MIKKGTWVEIQIEVLKPEERGENVPEETRRMPLQLWTKGYVQTDCSIGENVEVETLTGRRMQGNVTESLPGFTHDFGDFVEEILYIGKQARDILKG